MEGCIFTISFYFSLYPKCSIVNIYQSPFSNQNKKNIENSFLKENLSRNHIQLSFLINIYNNYHCFLRNFSGADTEHLRDYSVKPYVSRTREILFS